MAGLFDDPPPDPEPEDQEEWRCPSCGGGLDTHPVTRGDILLRRWGLAGTAGEPPKAKKKKG